MCDNLHYLRQRPSTMSCLISSIAAALQYISYYHPVDYIRSLAKAYEREQSPAAKDAIARGIPRLLTRVQGLAGTPYGKDFLTHLAPNAGLLTAAEAYGLLPAEISALLEKG